MSQDLVAQALTALKTKNYVQSIDAIKLFAVDHHLEIQHHLIKGLSEIALLRWNDACGTFQAATQQYPLQSQLWFNLGVAMENCGKLREARVAFEQCLILNPTQADAYGNLSNILRQSGDFIKAEEMALKALKQGAPRAMALNCLGLALVKQGRFNEAYTVYQQALNLESQSAPILGNMANLAIEQRNFTEAWSLFSSARSIQDFPIFQRDEGMARLLAGDFEHGFPLYEARLQLPKALRLTPACPRYRGEPLKGKSLLLLAEQGFGDTLMFCRYGKHLADQGAQLTWHVQSPLKKLLDQQLPGTVLSEQDPSPLTNYYLPILSLPYVLQEMGIFHFASEAYLKAPSAIASLPSSPAKKRIGLVWSGSTTHERDHERSIKLHQLKPLWDKNQYEFFSLNKGTTDTEHDSSMPLSNLDYLMNDFSDTAILLNQMDAVVTVDTSVAHLAGALGKKTYVMLPYCPDWRWGLFGESTPWYSSVTLLRQPSYADWDSVILEVSKKLAQELVQPTRSDSR